MPTVTYTKLVSDGHIKTVLQRMAEFLGKSITVHSGDRSYVPPGGSTTSLHLAKRAADFHVTGLADDKAYALLKDHVGALFDAAEGYEFILHGSCTQTGGPHLHIGHYSGKNKGLVVFKTEGLSPSTKGVYTPDPREISSKPVAQGPSSAPSKPVPTPSVPSGTPHEQHEGLTAAVGTGGKNLYNDVIRVQALLNHARHATHQGQPVGRLFAALAEDGDCRSKTLSAISLFQKHIVGFATPDGRVDPDGRTFRLLCAWKLEKVPAHPTPSPQKSPPQSTPHGPAPVTSPVAAGPVSFGKSGRVFPARDGYPLYAQGNNQAIKQQESWGKIVLATATGRTVSQIGCAMTSATMALSGISGQTVTPDEMAEYMLAHAGFSSSGDLQSWNQMGKLVKPAVELTRTSNVKADKIDQELKAGRPIIVHVDYYTRTKKERIAEHDLQGDHWILITGRSAEGQYRAHDPAGGRMITLHRMTDGRLEADAAAANGVKYRTVGNATFFNRGPGVIHTTKPAAPPPVAVAVPPPTAPVKPTTPKPPTSTPPTPATTKAPAQTTTASKVKLIQAPAAMEQVIRKAADKVGVDYGYMMAMAAQESAFDPKIEAETSSATGLYQFLKSTWLGVLKSYGTKHGYADAKFIDYSSTKKKMVVNASEEIAKKIYNLRKDATANALMGAEFAKENQRTLSKKLTRQLTPTDLYMAHFLGPSDATLFLTTREKGQGSKSAADMFPAPAEANTSIFYKNKSARSLDEVYTLLEAKIGPKAEAYAKARPSGTS